MLFFHFSRGKIGYGVTTIFFAWFPIFVKSLMHVMCIENNKHGSSENDIELDILKVGFFLNLDFLISIPKWI